jgi:hypothetical protein
MKNFIFLLFCFFSISASAAPLSYFEQFFDRINDITHDPDFPETELQTAKNDLYQVVMTSDTTANGIILSFSLKPDGRFSFWMLPTQHRWKNGQREFKIGKCSAHNGRWDYREGALYLDNLMRLEATFRDGLNLLEPHFLTLVRPSGTEDIEILINNGAIDTIGGFGPNDEDFGCRGFSLPFWFPIPNSRPW